MIPGTLDKTWYTSMACYTSSDVITQVFWHSLTRWLLLLFKYHFVWMKMLTVSFMCALVCGYNVWEWRKDWVFIRVQAGVLCMLVCMWVRVSFLQKKLDAPPSLDRCKILFLYRIKLSFMKCLCGKQKKIKEKTQYKAKTKAKCPEKKKKGNYKSNTKNPRGRSKSGIDNWLPALLLPLSPVLSRPCTYWMGCILLSVLCWTLEEACANWYRRSCIPNKLALNAWRWAVLLHWDMTSCMLDCLHSLDMTLHIIWLAGLPHNMSVLYTVGLAHHWTCGPVNKGCRWTCWSRHDAARHHLVWWNATRYCCQCCMLNAGRDAVKSCVGGLAGGDITLCMSLFCKCVTLLSRVQRRWIYWKGQVTISFWPWIDRLSERTRMGSFWRCHKMDALTRAMCRCTHWENTHLPRLCCAPLDLLKGHAMLYDEGSVCQHCHHVYAMAQLLSPPHWYVIGLS